MVYDVWTKVCEMNRDQYPDSNRVMPQDVIFLPLGQYYVAKPGGKSHMWDASVYFSNEVVTPYLNGTLQVNANPTEGTLHHSIPIPIDSVKTEAYADHTGWVLALIVALLAFLSFLFHRKNKKPVNPPFIAPERVPDPAMVTQEELRPLVQEAFGRVYGEKNFDIIGDVQGASSMVPRQSSSWMVPIEPRISTRKMGSELA
jgi:hypothetical protein